MITVSDTEVLEREGELDTLRALLADARDGRGAIALVEGPPGQGKTALLRAVRAGAAAAGLRVLSAIGAELERDFAFGLVRQLLPTVDDRLLSGAAAEARSVIDAPPEEAASASVCHARLHAIYTLTAKLADEQPLAIVVDDAHWGDAGSLSALGVLARRLDTLPIALVIGLRPEPHDPALDALFAAPGAIVIRPEPLSRDAVETLVADVL